MIYWKIGKRELLEKEWRGGRLKEKRTTKVSIIENELLKVLSDSKWNNCSYIAREMNTSEDNIRTIVNRLNRRMGYKLVENRYRYGYRVELSIL